MSFDNVLLPVKIERLDPFDTSLISELLFDIMGIVTVVDSDIFTVNNLLAVRLATSEILNAILVCNTSIVQSHNRSCIIIIIHHDILFT